ncbi:ABC transporter permease [Cohnella rhizosphaerae]|nr:ABC transporter permease subunit [Cohnella rhizosphaerae]
MSTLVKQRQSDSPVVVSTRQRILRKIWRDRFMYLLILPGALFFLIYRYVPMLGIVIAFQDFSPFLGFSGSEWVGLQHFRDIFSSAEIGRVLWNTISLSMLQILFAFPAPIILALLLNEMRSELFKRFIQSIVYLPHFLSWVVVVGIFTIFLRGDGIINDILKQVFGMNQSIGFLTNPDFFRPLIVLQVIWKEIGWGTIIFLAALAGVNPEIYEAASVDGANRWRRMWHITLPALRATIVIMLILRLGSVLDSGFEQIFLMLNSFNRDIGDVLDTYVYTKGVRQSDYSFATAVGLFKGVVGLVLVLGSNYIAKRMGEEGVY